MARSGWLARLTRRAPTPSSTRTQSAACRPAPTAAESFHVHLLEHHARRAVRAMRLTGWGRVPHPVQARPAVHARRSAQGPARRLLRSHGRPTQESDHHMIPAWLWVLLLFLTVHRLTRLVTADGITQ